MQRPALGLRMRLLGVTLLLVALLGLPYQFWPWSLARIVRGTDAPFSQRADNGNDNESAWPNPRYLKQAEQVADLELFVNDPTSTLIPSQGRTRAALLKERSRLQTRGDVAGVARLNAVLSAEAFARAAWVTSRWLDHRDPPTGLFPHTLSPKDRYFSYGDVGADLYPFLAISARYLLPNRYPEILDALAMERRLGPGFPHDLMLDTKQRRERKPEEQMLANVEYAKDGLLPLVELLGPDPWRGRMREVVDAVITAARVPTSRGPIPSDAAEVNGSLLQTLARLSYLDNDPRLIEMGSRIAAAYLDDALPVTGDIPPEHWNFLTATPIGDANLHLGDHGDEIVSGLIEWERVEARLNLPGQDAHRDAINRMLDRLLVAGRSSGGLWFDGIRFPSGKVQDQTLNDNWGYLGQAYLDQAALLRTVGVPNDERTARALRYEEATRETLRAVAGVRYLKWEEGNMDGYADTIESALYLLRYLDDAEAARWVDEQMAVLYGFQRDTGAVTDENIDGNYIRTAMLYGRWLTQGTRLEPWPATVSLGAAADGACLQLHLHAAEPWSGRLLFDTPRHRQHLGLPVDYPRLNQWQEWWVAEPDQQYAVSLPAGSDVRVTGAQLAAGLPLTLTPGTAAQFRVCGA